MPRPPRRAAHSADVQLTAAETHLLSVMDGELDENELALVCGVSVDEIRETLERMAMLGVVTFEPPDDEEDSSTPEGELEVQLAEEALPLIDALFDALKRTDHYTLLGLSRDADKNDVKRAYYRMAPAFHPDKHYGKHLGPYKSKIEAIFTQLTRAHDTLRYKRRRQGYDENLSPDSSRDSDGKVRLPGSGVPSGGMSASATAEAILDSVRTIAPPTSSPPGETLRPPSSRPSHSGSTPAPSSVAPAAPASSPSSPPITPSAGAGNANRPDIATTLPSADSDPPDSDPQITQPSLRVPSKPRLAAVAHDLQQEKRKRPSQVRRRILTPAPIPKLRPEPETLPPDPPEQPGPATEPLQPPPRSSKPSSTARPGSRRTSSPGSTAPRPSRPISVDPRSATPRSAAPRSAIPTSAVPRSSHRSGVPTRGSAPAPATESPTSTASRPSMRRPLSAEQAQRRRDALRRRLGMRAPKPSPMVENQYPPLPKEVPRSAAEALRNNFEDAARHARRKRFTRYFNAGRRAMEDGDYRAATAAFEQALKLDPEHKETIELAAKAMSLTGN